jgi:hypothetical protein
VFDANGCDRTTFKPFVLEDCRGTEWKDVRLRFDDWAALHALAGGDSLDGYYLNGYGVEGLVKAAMVGAGMDPDDDGIDCDSEGDTCYLHFADLATATTAATAAVEIFANRKTLESAVAVAREHGFED